MAVRLGDSRMTFVVACVLLLSGCAQTEAMVHFRISEEQAPHTPVGNVIQASNLSSKYTPEVLERFRFRFRSPDPLFEIVETTGLVRTRRLIDREDEDDCLYSTTCLKSQEVMVTPYAYFKIIPITIQIDDINDHEPRFPRSRVTLAISESISRNTTFSIPTAEDPDEGIYGVSKYELITTTDVFGIRVNDLPDGSMDLSVVVQKQLDREKQDSHSVQIRAVDGGKPARSGTVTVDITVVDSNDNSPVFDKELYVAQIYENLDRDTPVIQVHAEDHDGGANGVVFYEFDHHTNVRYGHMFGLHNGSGLIYVKGNIDYEAHKTFHLTVVAKDLGKNSVPDYAKVNIDIMDLNDNAPEVSVNTFTDNQIARIPENVRAKHTVAYVGVSDPDSGPGGNVTCTMDDHDFKIHMRSNSGTTGYEIVSVRQFDREKRHDYAVVVRCVDKGLPPQTSSVRISIRVTDDNDNSPYFRPNSTLFAVSMNENNRIGDVIIKMNTTDRDTMQNSAIRYNIEPVGDTPNESIAIDLITGVVTSKVLFDFESRRFYQYRVTATDQGDPPRYVTTMLNLNIIDQNDGIPRFLKPSYSFSVTENKIANTEVGAINAIDDDSPPFDAVVYSLEPIHDSYKFHVDPETGEIMTATVLDREENDKYHLIAVASNKGLSHIRAYVNVTVYIDDENDNPPVMVFPTEANNTVQVPTQMSIGYHVVQIRATDPDSNVNGRINFVISSGNEDGIFAIDPDTGAISAAHPISKGHLRRQTIILKISDYGTPERRTFARLNILFNQSVPLSVPGPRSLLHQDTLVILIAAAIGGCVFIVIVIAVAICCVRRTRREKTKKEHFYNCRTEEAKKALSSPISRRSTSSNVSTNSNRSIDTGISNKTKDKTKKEVQFSVDADDAWPLKNEKIVIENPHAQHIDPSDCRPPSLEMDRSPEGSQIHEYPRTKPTIRKPQCCVCQRHGVPPLTQHSLEALEYNNMFWHNSIDRDSESGCSGTDSGRGNSEEGECGHHSDQHTDHCGYGRCCCSSGVHAKRLHNLHASPIQAFNHGQFRGVQRECSCCGSHRPQQHPGHGCGPSCDRSVSPTSSPVHECSMDECTPLEALPSFGKPHRFYGKNPRCPDCQNGRATRQRLSLDAEEMAKHRQYGFAPSLPSLTDRHIPSPTFTSASDSQFYPYTGEPVPHYRRGMAHGNKTFTPLSFKTSPYKENATGSLTVSDDGTTTSGSYSMESVNPQDMNPKVITLDLPGQDCCV